MSSASSVQAIIEKIESQKKLKESNQKLNIPESKKLKKNEIEIVNNLETESLVTPMNNIRRQSEPSANSISNGIVKEEVIGIALPPKGPVTKIKHEKFPLPHIDKPISNHSSTDNSVKSNSSATSSVRRNSNSDLELHRNLLSETDELKVEILTDALPISDEQMKELISYLKSLP